MASKRIDLTSLVAGGTETTSEPDVPPPTSAAVSTNEDNMVETLLFAWSDMVGQFLDAASEVWPSCTHIAATRASYMHDVRTAGDDKRGVLTVKLRAFHAEFKPFYSLAQSRDESVLDTPALEPYSARKKWGAAHPSIRATCWEYARAICDYANTWSLMDACPTGMLSGVERTARNIAEKFSRGEMTIADLTPSNLSKFSKEILGDMSDAERDAFASRLRREGDMSAMYGMLQNMVKKMGGVGALLDGIGGGEAE